MPNFNYVVHSLLVDFGKDCYCLVGLYYQTGLEVDKISGPNIKDGPTNQFLKILQIWSVKNRQAVNTFIRIFFCSKDSLIAVELPI